MLVSNQLLGQINSIDELKAAFETLDGWWREKSVIESLKVFWRKASVSTGFSEDDNLLVKQNYLAEIFIFAAISCVKKVPIDYVYITGNEEHVYCISASITDKGSVQATWELLEKRSTE